MRRWVVLLILLLCFTAGCDTSQVADDLAQREANEIVAVLRSHHIDAETAKERGSRGKYSVTVAAGKFGEAVTVLHELGLPAERKASFSELVSQSGILPSSREVEALRLDRAIAAEIEDLLKGHPAISGVNAVVRYHALEGSATPSVSIVIQRRTSSALDEAELRRVVTRTVPGIKAEDVVIAVSEQPSPRDLQLSGSTSGKSKLVPFLGWWEVPEDDYTGLAGIVVGLLVLVATLSGLAGYIYGQYNLTRSAEEAGGLESLGGGSRLDRLEAPKEPEDDNL